VRQAHPTSKGGTNAHARPSCKLRTGPNADLHHTEIAIKNSTGFSIIQRGARALIAALFGATVALAALFRLGWPELWWVELLRYLPYPVYLVLAIAGLLASLTLSWVWRLLALTTLGLVLSILMNLAWGRADEGYGHLRVMSYNVKSYLAAAKPQNYSAMAAEIAWYDPDILMLQDASMLALPGTPSIIPAGYERIAMGQYVVASRHALRNCHSGEMPTLHARHHFMRCSVLVGDRVVELITAHLLSPRQGLNATRHDWLGGLDDWQQNYRDRLAQAEALASAVAHIRGPLVVAGDLNASEHSPVLRVLEGTGLRDAFSSAAIGYGYTVGHALRPGISLLRIDHILVSPEIGVSAVQTGAKEGSEHRPVIADLLLGHE